MVLEIVFLCRYLRWSVKIPSSACEGTFIFYDSSRLKVSRSFRSPSLSFSIML